MSRSVMLRAGTAVLIGLLPAALLFGITALVLHTDPAHFIPTDWNDQVGEFVRVTAFRAVGLHTGFYLPNELTAPVTSSRLGVEGPFYTVFEGAFAWLVPAWSPAAALYLNAALVGLALMLFATAMRLNRLQTLLLAALVVVTWPVVLYLATSSEEPLNIAIAIVLAAGFGRMLRRDRAETVGALLLGTVLLLAALERLSWAILFVPYAVLLLRGRALRYKVGGVVLAVVLIAILLRFQDALIPPVQNSVLDDLRNLRSAPGTTLRQMADLAWQYLKDFAQPSRIAGGELDITAYSDLTGWARVTTLAQSYEIVGLAAVSLIVCVRFGRRWRTLEPLAAFNAFNLIVITVASLLLYLPLGYYRLLAAHLLLTALLLVAERRYLLVGVLIVINLAVLPGFVHMYRGWGLNFVTPAGTLSAEKANVARSLSYQSNAPSPWCNTVLVPLGAYDQRMLAVPPGIGMSYVYGDLSLPAKSRWVLAERGPGASQFAESVGLQGMRKVAVTAIGVLYENPRSLCFDKRRQ